MKRHVINDTVEFRIGEKHLYGVITDENVDLEGQLEITVLAGSLLYRHLKEEDIIRNYGVSE